MIQQNRHWPPNSYNTNPYRDYQLKYYEQKARQHKRQKEYKIIGLIILLALLTAIALTISVNSLHALNTYN